jgi:glycosyltransferase involved in cell wall biosynthesis
VVDDGSTDRTRQVAEEAARRDTRIRVLRGRGEGIVPSLEQAREQATGEYLARMDADDVALPRRIAAQVALLGTAPRAAVCGAGVRYVPEDQVGGGARRYQRWLNDLDTSAQLVRDRFIECPLAHPTWLMRPEALEMVGGYRDEGWPEDYDLLLRLVEAGWGLAKVPDVLLLWREGDGRLSRNDPRYSAAAFAGCRAHYLARAYLDHDGVVIWGAGPTGKAFSRSWRRQGGVVRAFVELDPRKIRQEIHGAPVVPPEELEDFSGSLGVAAVGRDGARENVRRGFREQGWEEGEDFVVVA